MNNYFLYISVYLLMHNKMMKHCKNSNKTHKKSKNISDKSIFGTKATTCKGLIWVTLEKRNHIIEQYHNALLYSGTTRLIKIISTHFEWPGWQKDVNNFVNTCYECQRFKITGKKSYGKIPLSSSLHDETPWQQLHVDLCGEQSVNFVHKGTKIVQQQKSYFSSSVMHALTGVNLHLQKRKQIFVWHINWTHLCFSGTHDLR